MIESGPVPDNPEVSAYIEGADEFERRRALREQWGSKPCSHLLIEAETKRGTPPLTTSARRAARWAFATCGTRRMSTTIHQG